MKLYPLKFNPILKDKIWGGTKLKSLFNKAAETDKLGESWELSGIENDESVVVNGFLDGNTLPELIEIYMGELVGDNAAMHRRLLEKFLRNAQVSVVDIAAAVSADDTATQANLAHALKSAARSVGALHLGELCQTLESAAQAGDVPPCRTLAAQVAQALHEVNPVMHAHLSR